MTRGGTSRTARTDEISNHWGLRRQGHDEARDPAAAEETTALAKERADDRDQTC